MIAQIFGDFLKRSALRKPADMRLSPTPSYALTPTPMQIVDDARIRTAQKLRMLNEWETETQLSILAVEEELTASHRAMLDEIAAAKAALLRYSR